MAVHKASASAHSREVPRALPQPRNNARVFQRLVARWQRERGATSSITAIATCPAYQEIIAMGPVAIPLIFAQLEKEGDEPQMWFWALKALTRGKDPVRDEDRGDFRAMARAWLKWGRTHGYAR